MLNTENVMSPTKRSRTEWPLHAGKENLSQDAMRSPRSDQGVSPDSKSAEEEENHLMYSPTFRRRKSEDSDGAAVEESDRLRSQKVNNTAIRTILYKSVRDPVVQGSVTILHSLSQVELLLSLARDPTLPAKKIPEGIRIQSGETVMFIIHHGDDSLNEVIDGNTQTLSGMRVFTLNLATLPPQEYTEWIDHPIGPSASLASVESPSQEEEAMLLPPVPPSSGTPLKDTVPSFSQQLHMAGSSLTRRVTDLLQIDSVLNPHLRIDEKGSVEAEEAEKEKESLVLPSMVVWRAPRAPLEEYPPTAPPANVDRPAAPTTFNERMAKYGGPLVVKNIQGVDAVHSLSLWKAVFTLEHLYRTLAATLRAADTILSPSYSIIYFGASWCPPCMRIVHQLPYLMRHDIPSSVQCLVKADMDLADPIFQFFGVEVIPVFMVLDNGVLFPDGQEKAEEVPLATMEHRFKAAEKGRIQQSDHKLVSLFIGNHCSRLTFDEDF